MGIRKLLLNNEIADSEGGGGVPYLYTTDTGGFYIDTKIKISTLLKVEMGFIPDMTASRSNRYLFGGQYNSTSTVYYVNATTTANSKSVKFTWQLGYSSSSSGTKTLPSDEMSTLVFSYDDKLTINGSTISGTRSGVGTSNAPYMYLFNYNKATSTSSSPSTAGFVGRIYYCKIYDDGTLKLDLIPHKDDDGKPCMMDILTGKCYYEQGTTGMIMYGDEPIDKMNNIICPICGAKYRIGSTHTCPTAICDECGREYVIAKGHNCDDIECEYCGITYSKDDTHTCNKADVENKLRDMITADIDSTVADKVISGSYTVNSTATSDGKYAVKSLFTTYGYITEETYQLYLLWKSL